jgi:hypothetical protein
MTKAADIITDAMRETNLIAITAQPSPGEQAEALRRLQALVLSTLGNDVGYIMEDWNVGSASVTRPNGVPLPSIDDFTVRPNSRLIMTLSQPTTFKLDPLPQDGQRFSVVDANGTFDTNKLTLDPNGRKINGQTGPIVVEQAGVSLQWFYRSDVASWVLIAPLTPETEMPFPEDFDDFFIIGLAFRLNPRHGVALSAESKARLDQQHQQFIERYTQSRLRTIPAPAQ